MSYRFEDDFPLNLLLNTLDEFRDLVSSDLRLERLDPGPGLGQLLDHRPLGGDHVPLLVDQDDHVPDQDVGEELPAGDTVRRWR